MVNYTTSPFAALVGQPGPGGPVNPGFVPVNKSLNTRDVLSGFIGKGFTDLKGEDAKAVYTYLRNTLGAPTAGKLITHALMFNQRPDMQGIDPQKKVMSFYDMGSHDPEVNNIIARAGSVGYGAGEGMNSSPDKNIMDVMNRDRGTAATQKNTLLAPIQAGAALMQKRTDNLRK